MSAVSTPVPSFTVSLERDTLHDWLWSAEADGSTWGLEVTIDGDTVTATWPENVDEAASATNPRLSVTFTLQQYLAAAVRVAFEEVDGIGRPQPLIDDVRNALLSNGEDDNTDVEAYSAVLQTAMWGEVRIS